MAVSSGRRYDRRAASDHVDRVIAAFPAADAGADGGEDSDAPLFICGMLRSGSTLAERLLARHPRVTAGGELNHLPALVAERFMPFPTVAALAGAHEVAAARAAYLHAVRPLHPAGTLLIDKRLDNAWYLGLAKRLFPRARIVHTVRDARDNHLFVYQLHAGPAAAYATDLGEIAHHRAEQARLMEHCRMRYPSDIFTLDYDRLVASPAPVLAEFCGLEWDPAMLNKAAGGEPVRTASVWQVRQPMYHTSSGRWRNYARHLASVAQDCGVGRGAA